MKTYTPLTIVAICICLLFISDDVRAYNLKQVSNKDGLSNSAVLRIYQDQDRFLWLGTYDGLNIYDGVNIQILKPSKRPNSLSGNIIKRIEETDRGVFWIHTNVGLEKFDRNENHIKLYNKEKYNVISKNTSNQLFVVNKNDSISIYDPKNDKFNQFPLKGIIKEAVIHMSFDRDNILWLIPNTGSGDIERYKIYVQDNKIEKITKLPFHKYPEQILYAYSEQDMLYIVGANGNFSIVDRRKEKIRFVKNIENSMNKHGIISDIISDGSEFLISYKTSGVVRLYQDGLGLYEIEKLDLDCGVFSMYKDEKQNIVWFATDGQGAIVYSKEDYWLKSETFSTAYNKIKKPIRSIFLDNDNSLWIGTKGDGLFKQNNFDQHSRDTRQFNPDAYRMDNSELNNNSVFAFAPSSHNLFWIGSDGPGLNYYSYKTKNIYSVKSRATENIMFTHSIFEQNDSILWLASSGKGLQRVSINYQNDVPYIIDVQNFNPLISNNNYYTLFPENDSILWVGSRGDGVARFNMNTLKSQEIRWTGKGELMMNDILCIFMDNDKNIWLGTSMGLNRLISYEKGNVKYKNYGEADGLSNNTVHGILEDEKEILWLSTNNGIVKFNKKTNTFNRITSYTGDKIIEFSDNAYYKSDKSNLLFFGGINGIAFIEARDGENKIFEPDIYFGGLKIYGNNELMSSYMTNETTPVLELPHTKNFFSITFTAIDFINGANYIYEYQLEGFSDQWINNGISNIASFTNIPPGEYMLRVRYRNNNALTDSNIYTLAITILPPWYKTNIAYIFYVISIICLILYSLRLARKWYEMKKNTVIAQMTQLQKEEIYESKLRFFTNITHDLSTPLALIYGPCEKIISYEKTDNTIYKYASLIKYNAEKLNSLIQELIQFRRLETDNSPLKISRYKISEYTYKIAESFEDMAETKRIDYNIIIPDEIYWNTDGSGFSKIVTNLLSNAFKYTPENGSVILELNQKNEKLELLVVNTGKGIKKENLPKLFDRYQILDDFETNGGKGLSNRNGLGLAICHSIIKQLNGYIEVKSIVNEKTEFRVTLPAIEDANWQDVREEVYDMELSNITKDNTISLDFANVAFDRDKSTILIIDDDEEMLWFVSQIFIEKYNIIPLNDSTKVIEYLRYNKIDLVIMDCMMPNKDGMSITKEIKSDKILSHIPVILLSAKNYYEDQIKGIESGAELYITKPFNVQYLEKIVDQLLKRDESLKKYYNSVFSALAIRDGRVMHKEESELIEKTMNILEKNLTNPDFTVGMLSSLLGLSDRHLSRKLKQITNKTPSDIIKEYRMKAVERYLITTNMTIDEIIYNTGFNNRGNFYKVFFNSYGVTPKKYREEHTKISKDNLDL